MPKLPSDPDKLLICEVYQSIQGEGLRIGLPSVFVRVTGCPLRCKWCDEPRALTEGTVMTVNEIKSLVSSYRQRNVCLTGGEPLAHKQVTLLIEVLASAGYNVQIETSGALSIAEIPRLPGVTISMDVKCPSSGMHKRMKLDNLKRLRPDDEVKFVIADRDDYNHARSVMKEYDIPATIIFQPEGGRKMVPLATWVLQDRLEARVLPQLHKIIWGDMKGV